MPGNGPFPSGSERYAALPPGSVIFEPWSGGASVVVSWWSFLNSSSLRTPVHDMASGAGAGGAASTTGAGGGAAGLSGVHASHSISIGSPPDDGQDLGFFEHARRLLRDLADLGDELGRRLVATLLEPVHDVAVARHVADLDLLLASE